MKSVLVTGATGFVGRECLAPLRNRGFRVFAPERSQLDLFSQEAVVDYLRLHRPTHLLHLAWTATPGLYWTDPANVDWLEASLHLIRSFLTFGGNRFVTVGSCAEYAWETPFLSELSTPCSPRTLYGATKLALCHLSRSLAEAEKASYAHARLFYLFGPKESEKRLIGGALAAFANKRIFPTTDGAQRRDFLYVSDAADALAALLDHSLEGPCNIASGVASSVRDLLLQLASPNDVSLLRFGAIPRPPQDPEEICGDSQRLAQEVGWSPPVSLSERLHHVKRLYI